MSSLALGHARICGGGFGGTPDDIARYTAMGPAAAVKALVDFSGVTQADANRHLQPFDESSIHDPGLEPFPASRYDSFRGW